MCSKVTSWGKEGCVVAVISVTRTVLKLISLTYKKKIFFHGFYTMNTGCSKPFRKSKNSKKDTKCQKNMKIFIDSASLRVEI